MMNLLLTRSGKSRKIIVGKAIKALLSYFQDLRAVI
jgi:hypothetical protein